MLVYVFAVFLTQQVLDFRVTKLDASHHDSQLAYYFGSLSRTILTLYQAISGGLDWQNLTEPLMARMGFVMVVVVATYVALCILALMNVVTGMFVESAMES